MAALERGFAAVVAAHNRASDACFWGYRSAAGGHRAGQQLRRRSGSFRLPGLEG